MTEMIPDTGKFLTAFSYIAILAQNFGAYYTTSRIGFKGRWRGGYFNGHHGLARGQLSFLPLRHVPDPPLEISREVGLHLPDKRQDILPAEAQAVERRIARTPPLAARGWAAKIDRPEAGRFARAVLGVAHLPALPGQDRTERRV